MRASRIAVRLQARALAARTDRGDVPGWVLITIMTAGLVTVIYGVASDQLQSILRNALNSVRSP
jgi:hypothetical protein